MEYIVLILSIVAVIVITKVFSWPLKKILKLILNISLGLVMILVVNVFCQNIGLHIPFNIVTALVSGILGLPGVIALVVINYIF